MITNDQINVLANKNGVRRIAVENFLGTLGPDISSVARLWALTNLSHDAKSYHWNAATIAAIHAGIDIHFRSVEKNCDSRA